MSTLLDKGSSDFTPQTSATLWAIYVTVLLFLMSPTLSSVGILGQSHGSEWPH
jgi:hypothetical protein